MLRFEIADRVGTVVIDRADAGNAFTGEMGRQLGEFMHRAAADADIVTMMGAGPDFTVGRDRKEAKSASPFDAFNTISLLNKAIAEFPGILITGVRGRAFGLGVGFVMRSDIAIAAADAQFGLDEVAHGIPPMFIMEAMVEHLAPKRALELILGGRSFGAEEALQMGLLSQVVPAARLEQTVQELAATLRSRDRDVILACKQYLRAVANMPADARPAFALIEQTRFSLRKK